MSGYDGAIYKTCREAAGMTQEQAAERLNCSVRTLARWLHMDSRTVKATFPMKGGGTQGATCWISVASLARAMS